MDPARRSSARVLVIDDGEIRTRSALVAPPDLAVRLSELLTDGPPAVPVAVDGATRP